MAQFDPTLFMILVLFAGGIGSPRVAARHLRARLLFAGTVVAIWMAFVVNMLLSGQPHPEALFGMWDEHQILSDAHKLHLFTLSLNFSVPLLLSFVTITIVCYAALDERALSGPLSGRLRVVGQLPQNLTVFLFTGTSDTPHGPPVPAFAMSAA